MKRRSRTLAIVLIVANLGYFAWSQGAFGIFGFVPARFGETEPQRLTQQIRPELLQLPKAP